MTLTEETNKMRIDKNYLKVILIQVLNFKKADFSLNDFSENKEIQKDGTDDEIYKKTEDFIFHMGILQDEKVLESLSGENFCTKPFSLKLLRMTAHGHRYADDLLSENEFIPEKTVIKLQYCYDEKSDVYYINHPESVYEISYKCKAVNLDELKLKCAGYFKVDLVSLSEALPFEE